MKSAAQKEITRIVAASKRLKAYKTWFTCCGGPFDGAKVLLTADGHTSTMTFLGGRYEQLHGWTVSWTVG